MKKFEEFIKEDLTDWEEEEKEYMKAKILAKVLSKSFGVTCRETSKSLVKDYMFRHDLTKDEGYFGIKVTLKEFPMYSIDDYIKDIQKIKAAFEDLEALEIEHAKGMIFAFLKSNDKIENIVKSGKNIDKFKL
jgi:hypothetical protein